MVNKASSRAGAMALLRGNRPIASWSLARDQRGRYDAVERVVFGQGTRDCFMRRLYSALQQPHPGFACLRCSECLASKQEVPKLLAVLLRFSGSDMTLEELRARPPESTPACHFADMIDGTSSTILEQIGKLTSLKAVGLVAVRGAQRWALSPYGARIKAVVERSY